MKTNVGMFWGLFAFFFLVAVAYTIWAWVEYGYLEWVGTIGLLLCAIFGAFIGYYLWRTHKAQGGEMAEDREDANIEDGDSEIGHYSPWSWWPIALAGAAAVIFLGLAVGVWIVFIGVPLLIIALVGWVYEHYRGNFAR